MGWRRNDGRRRAGGWHTIACGVFLVAGCAAEIAPPSAAGEGEPIAAREAIETIDSAVIAELDFETKLLLDLRDPERAYSIAAGLRASELDRILLVCPNGMQMGLREWAATDRALAHVLVTSTEGWLGLSAGRALAEQAAQPDEEVCEGECYLCADGVWFCHGCAETGGAATMREPWMLDPAFSGGRTPAPAPGFEGGGGGEPGGGGSGGGGSGTEGSGGSGGSSGPESGGSYPSSPDPGGHPGR